MADYTITAAQEGVYEIALTPSTVTTVEIENPLSYSTVTVFVHSGSDPVYFSTTDATPAAQEQTSHMVPPSSWYEFSLVPYSGPSYLLALVSASTASVSVSRS